jgi:hypothetical protein
MPIGMIGIENSDISDSFMIKPSKHKETMLRIGNGPEGLNVVSEDLSSYLTFQIACLFHGRDTTHTTYLH